MYMHDETREFNLIVIYILVNNLTRKLNERSVKRYTNIRIRTAGILLFGNISPTHNITPNIKLESNKNNNCFRNQVVHITQFPIPMIFKVSRIRDSFSNTNSCNRIL